LAGAAGSLGAATEIGGLAWRAACSIRAREVTMPRRPCPAFHRFPPPLALFVLLGAGACRTPPYELLGTEDHSAQLVLGSRHSCALAGGKLACWGRNQDGELDDGTLIDRDLPTRAELDGALALAATDQSTCALLPGGEVRCWGDECGACDQTSRAPHGARDVRGLGPAASIRGSCALELDGSVVCWAPTHDIDDGLVYIADMVDRLPAVARLDDGPCAILADGSATCRLPGQGWVAYDDLAGALAVVRTLDSACALEMDGTVQCLSDDGIAWRPMPMSAAPAVALSAGAHHACALLADRTVACWGENAHGQIGDGTTLERFAPVLLADLADVRRVSLGGDHSCAALGSGDVRCWGANDEGQLGDGTLADRPTPISIGYTAPIQ
jgi:hypothetical protein